MGLFTKENRRTATAVAATDVELLCVRYDDLLELAAQNPQFGFYLMRLMMQRMQHNVELARARRDERCPVSASCPRLSPHHGDVSAPLERL